MDVKSTRDPHVIVHATEQPLSQINKITIMDYQAATKMDQPGKSKVMNEHQHTEDQ